MQYAEFEALFSGISLTPPVKARLKAKCSQSEGAVEARWVHRLITYYMYSPSQIACGVPAGAGRNAATSAVSADIVVYRDKQRKQPFIVVEVKKPKENAYKGIKQAESYARNLGAEYHVWSDLVTTYYFKTAKYIDQSTPVGNIPTWTEGKARAEYLSKEHVLPPFRDEEHLRDVVRQCHHKIFFNLGHDPAKSFDELMKLLFLKIYDERQTPKRYEFAILPGQTKEEVAVHIRALFKKAAESTRYRDVFTTRFSRPGQIVTLDLDDDTIFFLVKQFR